jgi:hypothetical protein
MPNCSKIGLAGLDVDSSRLSYVSWGGGGTHMQYKYNHWFPTSGHSTRIPLVQCLTHVAASSASLSLIGCGTGGGGAGGQMWRRKRRKCEREERRWERLVGR